MSDRERLHRPNPERTGPIRNWSTLYRRSDSWARREHPASADKKTTPDGADGDSRYGVELGYRVIEEHIREGRAAAEEIKHRDYASKAGVEDISSLLQRALRYSTDIVPIWLELLNSVAASERLRSSLKSIRPIVESALGKGATGNGAGQAASSVSIEIASSRPTRVDVDLGPGTEKLPLMTYGLVARDPCKSPLRDVEFVRDNRRERRCVRVSIPADQAAGTYSGTIVDSETGEVRGSLTVRIGD